MKLRCVVNRHRWGEDIYVVNAFARPPGAWWGDHEMDGEIHLALCRDCDVIKYDHVAMSRTI